MGTASKRRAPRWEPWPLCVPRGWNIENSRLLWVSAPQIKGALCLLANRSMACGFGVYVAIATHHLGVASSPLS